MKKNTKLKYILYTFLLGFFIANALAFIHAWKFTHFTTSGERIDTHTQLGVADKLGMLFFGVDNPRPTSSVLPEKDFERIYIQSNEKLECWMIRADNPKATVLMFHGYKGEKSELLERAYVLNDAGYNTMLVDMMGAGGSGGNRVTVGYDEAQNVRDCYQYLIDNETKDIVLFGVSMGAAALMRAVSVYQLDPLCAIVEAPFSTMYETVGIRFEMLGVPKFPLAHFLVIWGGAQHGFWGFSHNPSDYAQDMSCPTLIVFGRKDDRVRLSEEEAILKNLKGEKQLIVYEDAGHVNFMQHYKEEWSSDVVGFINQYIKIRQ